MRRREGLVSAYLQRLEQELEALYARYPEVQLDTVYFGGGTPSHLNDAELARIVAAFERTWGWPARLETTLEADPLTFDVARLKVFKVLGFSRLSIGLQSTQDEVLRFLGRQHRGREGLRAVTAALEAGFEVSADLITAVPEQDAAKDLHALAATGVPHVSVYSLTIEPYTPFALRGVCVDEEKDAKDYALAQRILPRYGLERYEVSNHAKMGHESQHNQVYWQGEYYLAAGPSAASFEPADAPLIGCRRVNAPIKAWLQGAAPEVHPVDAKTFVDEMLLTGLRTARGVDLSQLAARSGIDLTTQAADIIRTLLDKGLLMRQGPYLRATGAGLTRLNAVVRALWRRSGAA
jgi:putative oxygen-independent coproporphyrinogen III oxidase